MSLWPRMSAITTTFTPASARRVAAVKRQSHTRLRRFSCPPHRALLPRLVGDHKATCQDLLVVCENLFFTATTLLPRALAHNKFSLMRMRNGSFAPAQITKPISTNKLTVGRHKINRFFWEKLHILFHQLNSFSRSGATFLLQHSPQQRESDSFIDPTQHQDMNRLLAQIPIGAVNRQDELSCDAKQFDDQPCDLGKRQIKEAKKALTSFVMRVRCRASRQNLRDLNKTDSLNLNPSNDELRQELRRALFQVTVSLSVRSKRRMSAICSYLDEKCLAANLVRA